MKELDWRKSTDPSEMLRVHRRLPPFEHRKLRLVAVACCRRIWDLLTDDRCKLAIEVLERFLDGQETLERVIEMACIAQDVSMDLGRPWESFASPDRSVIGSAARAVRLAIPNIALSLSSSEDILEQIKSVAALAEMARSFAEGKAQPLVGRSYCRMTRKREMAAQADLLREIVGNPFRPFFFDPAWRTSEVQALASGIATANDFGGLPILGDALEEAGCDRSEILDHCRRPGGHVRGCWALELTLLNSPELN